MENSLNIDYLETIFSRASEFGANRALEKVGIIPKTITLAEVKKLHGKQLAGEARLSDKIKWMPLGKGGRTSGVYCLRTEFDKYLFKRDFSFLKK